MRILLFSFFFAALPLFADPKDPYSLAVTEGEPAALVEECVSVITGDLYLKQADALVQAQVPLRLPRHYLSGNGKGTLAGWSFINHLSATYKGGETEHKVTIHEPNGSEFLFKCPTEEVFNHFRKKKHTPKFRPPDAQEVPGLTNTAQGDISGHSNLKNACVRLEEEGKYLAVYCSDQTIRRYKVHHRHKHFKEVFKGEDSKRIHYLLESEALPSGHQIIYKYDHEDRLESVRTANPAGNKTYASATFHYHHKHADNSPDVDVSLSDGRTLRYRYEEKGDDVFLLKSVTSPESPEESIAYHARDHRAGNLVQRISLPGARYYDIDYYREGHNDLGGVDVKVKDKHDPRFLRVKTLKAPIGSDPTPHVTHRFFYFPDQRYTDVREIDSALIRYHYSPEMRLETILRFNHGDSLCNKETFEWSSSGDLRSRSFYDAQGNLLLSRRFYYDERGNILKEEYCGNLSGQNSREVYLIRREYSQDTRDLLLKEEEQNGKTTHYTYLPHSNLLSAKFVCVDNQIKIRTFYEYIGDHILVRETQDDGISPDKNNLSSVKTRTIKIITPTPSGPFVDMPQAIEEKYWNGSQELLLRKTVFSYTTGGRVESQEIYDATGTLRYTLHNTYDELGRLITETNPLGQIATYAYDASGNKTKATTASGRRQATMHYDYCNRLIALHEAGFDRVEHITRYQYDGKHNKTATTDPLGNETHYAYDAFGHVTQTHLPSVLDENGNAASPTLHSTYDSAGKEITRTDAKGHTTSSRYNSRSQVIWIQHPDNSQEHFVYNLDGTLKAHTDAEGHATTHTYDAFGRRIATKDPNGNWTKYIYDAFHLIAIQDAEGYTTTYSYDGAGRKIAEERNGERIEYTYDSLNRLHCVKTGTLLTLMEYDLLDRIVEERQEDETCNLLSQVTYTYDEAGNKKTITRSILGQEQQEHLEYDSFDRLIAHTDALGQQILIEYNENYHNTLGQRVLQKITTDPLGQKKIETYDSLNRLISTEILNPQATTCSFEECFYDLNHNLARQVSTLFPQKTTIVTQWNYDSRNRLSILIEPQNKTTHYAYTPNGFLKQTLKPNQVVLYRDYDSNGNLKHLSSSDHTIDYAFSYNALNQLTSSKDLLTQSTTTRTLDAHGRILSEKLANNLTLANTYDPQGRRSQLTLPHAGQIDYTYDALHLRQVSRYTPSGHLLYTHNYNAYDLSNHLLSETLIHNLGQITHTFSPLGKKSALSSPYFSQNVTSYDPVGNITSLTTQSKSTTYAYDGLYQLTQETGFFSHTYTYDSHYNRLQKDGQTYTLNALNQLSTVEYDPNGNPCLCGDTHYTYDALDRLVSLETPQKRLVFSYDSFHRRLSKTVYKRTQNTWKTVDQQLYFYDGHKEIGATDSTGKITQLRILGSTPHAEIGAALAIELQDQVYAPLHDLFGNIVALIASNGSLTASYHYDSFGNHTTTTRLSNPWRFASKRLDESGLIYFGRRYFDPTLGRWLTPDPIGFDGGINLYAFVQNNPLIHQDLYGLSIYINPLPVTTPMVVTPQIAPPAIETKQIAIAPLPEAPSVDHSRSLGSRAKATVVNTLRNPRFQGSMQALGGLAEAGFGGGMTLVGGGFTAPVGWPIMAHGLDQFFTGINTIFTGRANDTLTSQLLQKTGLSPQIASMFDGGLSIAGSMGAAAGIRTSMIGAFPSFFLPSTSLVATGKTDLIWSVRGNMSSVENAFSHWKKHGIEFQELCNAKHYVEKARNFLSNPPSETLMKTRPNGEILLYHPETNSFASFTKEGVPKTLFKPDTSKHKYNTNLEYFNAQ